MRSCPVGSDGSWTSLGETARFVARHEIEWLDRA